MTTGSLRGPAGGLVTVTNHGPAPLHLPVRLPAETAMAAELGPAGEARLAIEGEAVEIELPPYGAAAVGWRAPEAPR